MKFGSFLPKDACKFDRSRQELSNDPYSNENLFAKFGFDTAENIHPSENEPPKVCQELDS